ncbi:uncharacterized protein LOC6545140 [Drosophila erecta]|uniref:Uncharacterized protein n=1 Tax=Drosophila erecta TaxID=7220 RepID=B3NHK2_DROER|nr:uncharacterized protein LOC6545140 [Drosophila erecta]EDV51797.2 uncharacterized protein Dere_GG15706 [Drosophila erecta]
MKAIRCKSSSQVSSQVMIRVVLMLLYLVPEATLKRSDIGQAKSTKTSDNKAFQIFRGDTDKYELCIKLKRVCHKLWDQAPDYTDAEEKTPDGKEVDDDDKAAYKKGDCIPTGLSKDGEKLFWKTAAKWQKEIDDKFLIQNLFVVLMTTEDGRNTKLAIGKWQGWCNRTDNSKEMTVTPEYSIEDVSGVTRSPKPFKNCDVNGKFGKWISNEINGTRQLDKDINVISDYLLKFDKYAKSKCCPYDSIRDRLEMINDGIDFLQELLGIETYSQPNYTDVNADISNLMGRLENFTDQIYKNGGAKYSTGKCCPNIFGELEIFKNDFVGNLKYESIQPPKLDHQPFIDKENSLRDMILSQIRDIGLLETSLMNQTKKTPCCEGERAQIGDIEQLIKDIKPEKSLGEILKQIEPLNENLAQANKTISSAESLLVLEKENLQEINKYGEECHPKDKSFKNIESKVNHLEYKINNLSLLEYVDWPKLRKAADAVDKMVKDSPLIFANITIISMKNNMKHMKTRTTKVLLIKPDDTTSVRFCTNESIKLIDSLEKIGKDKNSTIAYHNQQENIVKEHFKELLDNEKELQYYSPTSLILTKGYMSNNPIPYVRNTNSFQLEINQLERDIDNLTENGIEKLERQLQYTRLRYEMDQQKVDKKIEEQLRNIHLFREEMKREQNRIDERLAKLDDYMLETSEQYDDKISKLEAEALEFPKQIASFEKTLLEQIASLQQQLKELEKESENTEHRANICDAECDFGDLNSIDELMKRVQVVKNKLNN